MGENVEKSTLLEDLREVRKNWHDPEYRRGFLSGFIPSFLRSFIVYGLVGMFVGYMLASLLG